MMMLVQIADISTNTLRLNQDLRVSLFGNERIVTPVGCDFRLTIILLNDDVSVGLLT
jgi:hypothetical protein